MKKNIYIFLVALAFIGSSCNDFLSVNETNPNTASSVAARLVLPTCLNSVAATMNNPRRFEFVYLWHGLWSISAGYTQPTALTQYKLLNSSYQNAFLESYTTAKNLDDIEKSSTDPKDVYFLAVAKIMKAYIFQNLVDCWGDVPYSEAFQTSTGNLKPKYDKQQDIYEDLIVQLDAAIGLIQGASIDANAIPTNSDIVYQGNMNKWLKFANTLKLRILIHQSDMAGRTSYITTKLATTASVGYLGAGEGALNNPGYLISSGKMNPFYETFYKSDGSAQSDATTYYFAGKDAIDFLKATNDGRIAKFYQPYSGSNYAGNIFGTLPANLIPQAVTSKLGYIKGDAGTMVGTPTKSAPILTDFEALFLQAEAVQRGLITGDLKALYEGAVTQSFLYMGLTSANAADFLAQNSTKTNITVSVDPLDLILTQKWIALNGIAPVEIWTDVRRTGKPTFLQYSPEPTRSHDTPPIRLLYPQNELDVNNDNVQAVGTIDAFTSKIFWQNR
jgi:hypothetical protein